MRVFFVILEALGLASHFNSQTRLRHSVPILIYKIMRKYLWNLENIKSAIERFNVENGRYPTAQDFDSCSYLPWSRQLQRRFGGLVELRKLLKIDCPADFTVGQHGSDRARSIAARAICLILRNGFELTFLCTQSQVGLQWTLFVQRTDIT